MISVNTFINATAQNRTVYGQTILSKELLCLIFVYLHNILVNELTGHKISEFLEKHKIINHFFSN